MEFCVTWLIFSLFTLKYYAYVCCATARPMPDKVLRCSACIDFKPCPPLDSSWTPCQLAGVGNDSGSFSLPFPLRGNCPRQLSSSERTRIPVPRHSLYSCTRPHNLCGASPSVLQDALQTDTQAACGVHVVRDVDCPKKIASVATENCLPRRAARVSWH